MKPINLEDALGTFADHLRPRIIGQFQGAKVQVVKLAGDFVWHKHDDSDDLFPVLPPPRSSMSNEVSAQGSPSPRPPAGFPIGEIVFGRSLRLLVRPLVPSDTDAWVSHVRDDAEHLGEFLGWPARTADPAVARQFIARYAEQEAGRRLLLGAFEGRLREAGLHNRKRQDLDLFSLVGTEIDQACTGIAAGPRVSVHRSRWG